MGWYADTSWDLTVRTSIPDLCAAVADALEQVDPNGTASDVAVLRGSDPDLRTLTGLFNEDTAVDINENGFTAWGSGKAWTPGEAPRFKPGSDYNLGGYDLYTVLAQHCTGTIDWDAGNDSERWRVRFYGDGTWTSFAGEMTYPGDPDGIMHAIATAIAAEDTAEAHTLMCLAVLDSAPTSDLLNTLAGHPDQRVRDKVTRIVASAAQT